MSRPPITVTGAGLVNVPPGAVWAMVHDPGVLSRAIPGCLSFEMTGPGRCTAAVTTAIAAVAGTYAGEAAIRDRREPSLITAAVSVTGARGRVAADVTVRLAPADGGSTEAAYEIDARVDGAIAGVGQLVLAAIAKRLAREFLAGLESAAMAAAVPAATAAAVPAATAAAVPAATAAAVPAATAAAVPAATAAVPAATATVPVAAAAAPEASAPGGRAPDRAEPIGQGRLAGPDEAPAAPRRAPALRAGVLAGAAIGLAGIAIGAVLGKRGGLRGGVHLGQRHRAGRRGAG